MEMRKRIDIARWYARNRNDFVGNRELLENFYRLGLRLRQEVSSNEEGMHMPPMLIVGPSRSGKTAAVNWLVGIITCEELNAETGALCPTSCKSCRDRISVYGTSGLQSFERALQLGHHGAFNFKRINCARVFSPVEFEADLTLLLRDSSGVLIIHLDEAHRLKKKGMEEILLNLIEDHRALWILSTAKHHEMEDMLRNRLSKISTEIPTAAEVEIWLAKRCRDWLIKFEIDGLKLVVQKANCIPGIAQKALEYAYDYPEGLTLERAKAWASPLDVEE